LGFSSASSGANWELPAGSSGGDGRRVARELGREIDGASVVADTAERTQPTQSAPDGDHQFRLLVDSVKDHAIYTLDPNGVVTTWNSGAQRIKQYTPAEIIGQNFALFFTAEDRAAGLPARALKTAATEGCFEFEGWRVRKDGSRFWASVAIHAIRDDGGALIGFAKVTRDISERRANEERLYRLAHIDGLTGLPNRRAFLAKLEEIVAQDYPATLLLLDLDDFKSINDMLGHRGGDAILKAAAQRIRNSIGERGMVARLGGDEFAIVLSQTADPVAAAGLCEQLNLAFRPPFAYEEHQHFSSVSIGVALRPMHGTAAEELLGSADLALYRAKAEGRNGYSMFEMSLREAVVGRAIRERELRRAGEQGKLELLYQPQVRLADRSIVGAEALLRWPHPTEGLLSPAAFLGVLEKSSLASAVGDWVLRSACAHAADARRLGLENYCVGVNLFGAQFRARQLVSTVVQSLRDNGLPPAAIELEITENIILQHDAAMIVPLRELRNLGVRVAFDDYGTGYASLSLLKRFPLSRLKIDRSLIRDLCLDPKNAAVVTAILYLARSFGLDVTAEGVETERQDAVLRELECVDGQGYLYGRPMPAQQILASIAEQVRKDKGLAGAPRLARPISVAM